MRKPQPSKTITLRKEIKTISARQDGRGRCDFGNLSIRYLPIWNFNNKLDFDCC